MVNDSMNSQTQVIKRVNQLAGLSPAQSISTQQQLDEKVKINILQVIDAFNGKWQTNWYIYKNICSPDILIYSIMLLVYQLSYEFNFIQFILLMTDKHVCVQI